MVDDEVIHVVMDSRANILGLLSMSVMLGAVLSVTASESDSLLNLFVGLSNATVTVSQLTAWVSPVGVFFLVATRLSQTSELDHSFGAMGTLLLVSVAALAAYGLGLLPVLYVLVTRKDARRFLRITCVPAMKAFRSASRTESVPGTIEALEDLAGLDPRVVRFVVPVGANVSMSGTAVVAAATAVVIARLDGVQLGAVEACIIGTTVVLASLGAASIPNSSVLTVLMILMALRVSSRNISLVFVIDWAVDRFRTTVNVYSDSVGSAIVQQFSPLETFEDSGEETSVVQTQVAPKPAALPPQSKPEPGLIIQDARPKDELNREIMEEPEVPSSWFKRRLSMLSDFSAGQGSADGARRKSSLSSASSHGALPMGPGSSDVDVAPSPGSEHYVETSHVNDSGAFSPLPEGITVFGGSPTASICPRMGTGATPSSAARSQDEHKDLPMETPRMMNTAAPDGTGAVGDVSSGKGRRHRRPRRVKDTKDSVEKAPRKSVKVDSNYPHPRHSGKSRAKKSSHVLPKAVTVHVPDQVPLLLGHAARVTQSDLGSEAAQAQYFVGTVGAVARPAT
ncbi:neutral amino acid transporter A-like [Rhipicephalus microplus]|uniref:neutral amino acid transporter A-like n=1 Tax=Rhipicephalus microplus TaxID=6941 RepID=UPI003F6D74EB